MDYPEWEFIESKTITDWDGFNTDYTLWYDSANNVWCCIYGDSELYDPYNTDPDAEFESEDEAWEWFNSYEGGYSDDDEDDEIGWH